MGLLRVTVAALSYSATMSSSVWRGEGLSVIVPFRPEHTGPVTHRRRRGPSPSGAPRDELWQWLRRRYDELLPGAQLIVADTDHEKFSRSAARNAGAATATRDVLLLADADTVFDVDQLARGVAALGQPHAGICDEAVWCVPYRRYVGLTGRDTCRLLEQPPTVDVDVPRLLAHDTTTGTAGLLLVTAAAFAEVGGYDERFAGWGYEDTALTMTLETLHHGCVRTDGVARHLCHPKSPRRRVELAAARPLFSRYQTAHYDLALMRELIAERDQ